MDSNQVQVNREKIHSIMDWPPPKNISHLHDFFVICSYYRWFVKGFSHLDTSLEDIEKKGVFRYIDDAQRKFDKLMEV